MGKFKQAGDVVCLGMIFFILSVILPKCAEAYVDPGTTGMLSQVLYVLFYAMLGVFFYILKYIKEYLASIKQFLMTFFGRKT